MKISTEEKELCLSKKKTVSDVLALADEAEKKLREQLLEKASKQTKLIYIQTNSKDFLQGSEASYTDEAHSTSSKAGSVKKDSVSSVTKRSRSWSEDSEGRPKPGSRKVVKLTIETESPSFIFLLSFSRNI